MQTLFSQLKAITPASWDCSGILGPKCSTECSEHRVLDAKTKSWLGGETHTFNSSTPEADKSL